MITVGYIFFFRSTAVIAWYGQTFTHRPHRTHFFVSMSLVMASIKTLPAASSDAPVDSAPATEIDRGSAVPSTQKSATEPDPLDEATQWRKVFTEFVALKKKLGEPTKKLTYEKFKGTLQRNKDALIARHHCVRVKFRVYEKQGRAALKASPVK